MRVRSFDIPQNTPYLTSGKWYKVVTLCDADTGAIIDDDGDKIYLYFGHCPHLNGGAWEIEE